jgi:hypothetical protein
MDSLTNLGIRLLRLTRRSGSRCVRSRRRSSASSAGALYSVPPLLTGSVGREVTADAVDAASFSSASAIFFIPRALDSGPARVRLPYQGLPASAPGAKRRGVALHSIRGSPAHTFRTGLFSGQSSVRTELRPGSDRRDRYGAGLPATIGANCLAQVSLTTNTAKRCKRRELSSGCRSAARSTRRSFPAPPR